MSSEFGRTLRRIKPQKKTVPFQRRPDYDLEWVGALTGKAPAALLLDTTVYIDTWQGRLPDAAATLLHAVPPYHCSVTEAELAAACGMLDPNHPETAGVIARVRASVDKRPAHRQLAPDRAVWREAGLLAGMLARCQQYGKAERHRLLNDALIFCTALKHGCAVLTRNLTDFDLLMQAAETGRAIFYRSAAPIPQKY